MTWDRFWFRPISPQALGLVRAVFCGVAFLHYLPVDFSGWREVDAAFWSPGVLLAPLSIPILLAPALVVLQIFWKCCLLLAAVGLFTRAALVASFVTGLYLLTLRNGFVGIRHHEDCVAAFVLLILAAAHAGDAVSLDRWRTRAAAQASGEYQWPLRLIQCFLSLIFLGAAVAKLRHSGFAWAGEVFPSFLLIGHYDLLYARPLLSAAPWLYAHHDVAGILGWAALALEVVYGGCLVFPKARFVVVPAMVGLLLAIRLVLGPCFIILIAAQIVWVTWPQKGAG